VTAPSLAGALLADRPAEMLVVLGALALAPIAAVMLTSFLKIVVVLGIARSALGAPQVPPSSAVTGFALALTVLVMSPVADEALAAARRVPVTPGVQGAVDTAKAAAEPLRSFIARFATPADREVFLDLAQRARKPADRASVTATDFSVLVPAFVVSELRSAFTTGFLVFVPFLVVDLLVANVLLALGLSQMSPTSAALPFKLLLFVAVDGWKLLARGLVLGYLA
jgi:type III secretion protein R